jgi:hypothetical protein
MLPRRADQELELLVGVGLEGARCLLGRAVHLFGQSPQLRRHLDENPPAVFGVAGATRKAFALQAVVMPRAPARSSACECEPRAEDSLRLDPRRLA